MTDTAWLEEQYRPWKLAQSEIDVETIVENWSQMSMSYLDGADIERNISYGTMEEE